MSKLFSGKCFAISGIAGFIGLHVACKLQELGARVVGFDNFEPCYDEELKKARQEQLEEKGILCEILDLCDQERLETFFAQHRPDATLHLAAKAGVRSSLEQPSDFITCNIAGFVKLLEVLKKHPQNPLLYASSSSVYGLQEEGPFHEESGKEAVCASIYGATKKCDEILGATYVHLYGMQLTALRFFTVYGPWGRPDMAYWLFTEAIEEGRAFSLFNEGKMQRDFTYIDDIVEGVIGALNYRLQEDQSASQQVLNLGTSSVHSLEEFVQSLEEALGKKGNKRLEPMQKGDVLTTHADISKAATLFGYKPKVSLQEGLKRFTSWYRAYQARESLSLDSPALQDSGSKANEQEACFTEPL